MWANEKTHDLFGRGFCRNLLWISYDKPRPPALLPGPLQPPDLPKPNSSPLPVTHKSAAVKLLNGLWGYRFLGNDLAKDGDEITHFIGDERKVGFGERGGDLVFDEVAETAAEAMDCDFERRFVHVEGTGRVRLGTVFDVAGEPRF